MFEILNSAFVGLCGASGIERAQISAFSSLWIFLSRVKAKLTRFEFPDHVYSSRPAPRSSTARFHRRLMA